MLYVLGFETLGQSSTMYSPDMKTKMDILCNKLHKVKLSLFSQVQEYSSRPLGFWSAPAQWALASSFGWHVACSRCLVSRT